MPVRSMTLTTVRGEIIAAYLFQMPVRSMTLTTLRSIQPVSVLFQMPVRSMTLTTNDTIGIWMDTVSDACQINDFDHRRPERRHDRLVSDACQINDFDHMRI